MAEELGTVLRSQIPFVARMKTVYPVPKRTLVMNFYIQHLTFHFREFKESGTHSKVKQLDSRASVEVSPTPVNKATVSVYG